MSELILGTAQWGTDYGVTNVSGRVTDSDLNGIVQAADQAGVRGVDTALSYGDAQHRLRPWAAKFNVTTKVSGKDVMNQVSECLGVLNLDQVNAVLVHDWDALESEERLEATYQLKRAVDQGWIRSAGVSVYDTAGIQSALATFTKSGLHLGVTQVPASVVDQRLDGDPSISDLKNGGSIVQVRSVLLQGLLAKSGLTGLGRHPDIVAFHAHAAAMGVPAIEIALAHVKSLEWVDEIVVGVTSAREFGQLVDAWHLVEARPGPAQLASRDLNLVDPRRW